MRRPVVATIGTACLSAILVFILSRVSWLQEGGQGSRLEQMLGQKSIVGETEHFRTDAYESLGKAGLEAWGKKAEESYELGCKVFDQPKERRLWGNSCIVMMIKTKVDWERWVDATVPDKGQARISKECCGTRLGDPGGVVALEMMGGNQASLEQMALHMIGHHILDFWDRKSDHVPVWIEEGFASYIEFEIAKDVGSSCIGGGTAANPAENKWRDGADWKGLLKDAVMNGKDKEAGSNLTWDAIRRTRDYNSMAHSQRAKSWSLITFLISLDNKKFQAFIKEVKGMEKGDWQAQDRAIQKAYEMTFNDLETEWRKYVTKEY